jgi:hypothetical protein
LSNYAKTDDPRKAKLFKTVQEATIKADLELKGFSFRVEPSHTGRPGYVLKCWPAGQLHYQEGRFWVTDARAAAIRHRIAKDDVITEAMSITGIKPSTEMIPVKFAKVRVKTKSKQIDPKTIEARQNALINKARK